MLAVIDRTEAEVLDMEPEEIAGLRARFGLTQQEMADKLGVHLRTWQQWEYGRRKPPAIAVTLFKLLATMAPRKTSGGSHRPARRPTKRKAGRR